MMIGTVDGERMLEMVNVYTRAFFDFYLKGVESDILSGKKRPYAEVNYHPHMRQ
jgi:hypothetical protein